MSRIKIFLSKYCFRIAYILFILTIIVEAILKYFYFDVISNTVILNYLFWFFLGAVAGSFLTIQSIKYLKNESLNEMGNL